MSCLYIYIDIFTKYVTLPLRMEKIGYHSSHVAYVPRHNMQLRDLPENHLKRCKEVPFEFHDYRVFLS